MKRSDVEAVIRDYIGKSLHMSLATSVSDKPWVCEVHFVFDERLNLYFRSRKASRHCQEIAANPSVAGNIVTQHTINESVHGVYFEGAAMIIGDTAEQNRIFPLFQSRLGTDGIILDEAQQPEGHKFYKVVVENWFAFGAFGSDSSGKYQLVWKGGTL